MLSFVLPIDKRSVPSKGIDHNVHPPEFQYVLFFMRRSGFLFVTVNRTVQKME